MSLREIIGKAVKPFRTFRRRVSTRQVDAALEQVFPDMISIYMNLVKGVNTARYYQEIGETLARLPLNVEDRETLHRELGHLERFLQQRSEDIPYNAMLEAVKEEKKSDPTDYQDASLRFPVHKVSDLYLESGPYYRKSLERDNQFAPIDSGVEPVLKIEAIRRKYGLGIAV